MQRDLAAAHARLKELFLECGGDSRAVAKKLNVNRSTLHRWIERLKQASMSDPRDGARGKGGRKPKADESE